MQETRKLKDRNVVVIGGSRGVGLAIVEAAHSEGANVLAVARGLGSLAELQQKLPGVKTLAMDAAEDAAPQKVFEALSPDLLVICGGAAPVATPLHEQSWEDFTGTWNTDVRASFYFCKSVLRQPMRPGTTVVLISSGAAIGGSPISGGYAGAKRMQMFMAVYCQKESDRLGLGLRFLALAPMRLMPETGVGKVGVEGYSKYLGISTADVINGIDSPQTPEDVARAVIQLVTQKESGSGNVFLVSGNGVEAMA